MDVIAPSPSISQMMRSVSFAGMIPRAMRSINRESASVKAAAPVCVTAKHKRCVNGDILCPAWFRERPNRRKQILLQDCTQVH